VTVLRVGMALAAGHGACATTARTEPFSFDADALAAGDAGVLAAPLRAARLAAAREAAGRVELHVALCAPWTAPRELSLPPMRVTEARVVLTRDHARHFALARAEPVVAARPLRSGVWLAADADSVVLDALARAALDAGYSAVRIVPAAGAWAAAAGAATTRAFVVDDECVLLSARDGRVTALRRMRAADAPPAGAISDDALGVAARHAADCSMLELVGREAQTNRASITLRLTRRLLGVAAAALVAAALAAYSGASRRVASLEAARAAIQPTARVVGATYDALAELHELRSAIRAARTATPWSVRLAALASALPDDANFTAFRAAGDSAVIEGAASSASETLSRLRRVAGVRDLRELPAGPADDEAREPFAAVVRFHPGGAP